jgi:hypothetical protein
MKNTLTKVAFWFLAILITLGSSVYQRLTGPTNPKRITEEFCNVEYSFKLPRSGNEEDCAVVLKGFGAKDSLSLPDDTKFEEFSASIFWKRYPTNDEFQEIKMNPTPDGLTGYLPAQPAAGKLEYYIVATKQVKTANGEVNRSTKSICKNDPLIIRFKSNVPAWVLIPHILCMFISMLFAAYALLCAIANMEKQYKRYTLLSFILIIIGGFIFGPIVQKYAFDIYWSGFPYGSDLTDNKTLFAAIALLAAVLTRKFNWNRWMVILAVLVMFVVFSIPHSTRGSELNYNTGTIETAE